MRRIQTSGAIRFAIAPYRTVEQEDIRASLNKGLAVGVERFKDQIEAAVARSVRSGQAGRRKERATGRLSGEQESLQFEERAK